MKKFYKMLVVSGIVALASQINISLFIPEFKISFGIILFPVFLFSFRDLNSVKTGILTAIMVYLGRLVVTSVGHTITHEALWLYFPEIIFYGFYGVFFSFFNRRNQEFNINKLFFTLVVSDYFSNLIELSLRLKSKILIFIFEVLGILLLVAMVRASMVWVILNGLKYYRLFVLKQEHEERYKKLLLLTSKLKTEMYWMRKNMDNIEKVMSDAYGLFEKISANQDRGSWASISANIAKDVHEIKKEYQLVLRGVEETLGRKLKDEGMYFYDLAMILKQSLINDESYRKKQINLVFKTKKNFYTANHYYLMSIFRNVIVNAIEAIDETKGESKVIFEHDESGEYHIFRIMDQGSGIKDKDLQLIFLPGYSTKVNYDTGHINRGLGLSLVKDVVEDYLHGKITVQSTAGMGTTFEITIPKESLEVDENENIYN